MAKRERDRRSPRGNRTRLVGLHFRNANPEAAADVVLRLALGDRPSRQRGRRSAGYLHVRAANGLRVSSAAHPQGPRLAHPPGDAPERYQVHQGTGWPPRPRPAAPRSARRDRAAGRSQQRFSGTATADATHRPHERPHYKQTVAKQEHSREGSGRRPLRSRWPLCRHSGHERITTASGVMRPPGSSQVA